MAEEAVTMEDVVDVLILRSKMDLTVDMLVTIWEGGSDDVS